MKNKKEITVINSLQVPVFLFTLMWLVFLFEITTNTDLSSWGVLPRHISGLWGIIFYPFLHADWEHIINNSPPILILGWSLYYFYRNIATEVLIFGAITSGLFLWIGGRANYHIGMSGVIYFLAFFLFFSGVFRKEIKLMAISLFVAFLYGSMVWGIFPIDLRVSFEGHFFGALMGVIFAYFYQREGATFGKKTYQYEKDEAYERKMEKLGYRRIEDENGFTIGFEKEDLP